MLQVSGKPTESNEEDIARRYERIKAKISMLLISFFIAARGELSVILEEHSQWEPSVAQ